MTLPHEEVNALKMTREFLYKLLIVKGTPKWIKDEARCCLRHYPIVIDDTYCSGKTNKLDYKAKQPRHVT